jgi:hypothetical protein
MPPEKTREDELYAILEALINESPTPPGALIAEYRNRYPEFDLEIISFAADLHHIANLRGTAELYEPTDEELDEAVKDSHEILKKVQARSSSRRD